MKASENFQRNVWRKKRQRISVSLHPDIVSYLKKIAGEEELPLSVVFDEVLYAGLKHRGHI